MTTAPTEGTASCADDHDAAALSIDDATRRIRDSLAPIRGHEQVALREGLGRALVEDVHAGVNVPGHANSAMDGYALRGDDIPVEGIRELQLLGTAWAGRPFSGTVEAGQCVRIMTGAPMPAGPDTVVPLERAGVDGQHVRIAADSEPGQNVRHAGEDIAAGDRALAAGTRLMPAHLGLLAALGIGEVKVRRSLRVAFFSTGDELRSIGQTLEPGAIHDSNRYTLYGMLRRVGAEILDMGVVRDEPAAMRQAFAQAATCADVVISSGGVSMGEADLVKDTLAEIGEIGFWRVALKPGRPLAFGRIGKAAFFGLPGNPVTVMVTFYALVRPALHRLMGEPEADPLMVTMPCASKLRKKPGRVEYQRGVLEHDNLGRVVVRKTGPQGSALLTSMTKANCFIVLPMDWTSVEPGTQVPVMPFASLV